MARRILAHGGGDRRQPIDEAGRGQLFLLGDACLRCFASARGLSVPDGFPGLPDVRGGDAEDRRRHYRGRRVRVRTARRRG